MGKLSIVFVRRKEVFYFFSAGVSAAGASAVVSGAVFPQPVSAPRASVPASIRLVNTFFFIIFFPPLFQFFFLTDSNYTKPIGKRVIKNTEVWR